MDLVGEAGPDDWASLREIRLAALLDAPQAFGSTYQREARFTEAQWRERFKDRAVTFLAHLDEDAPPAGIAGVWVDDGAAELVSMWVRPDARGRGVGEALVMAATGWAKAQGHGTLFLWVTELNAPARRLYERCGFTPSGEQQPLPSHPTLAEIRMRRPL
jgi:GNAT superfamily N-acetyltransferase